VTTFVPVRVTAMYRAHVALGARFTSAGDWNIADAYTSVDDEIARAMAGAGIADISACDKIGVRGAAVDALLTKITGQAAPAVGRSIRARVNGAGALVARVASDEALILATPASVAMTDETRDAMSRSSVAEIVTGAAASIGCAHVTDLTSAFAIVDLVGPAMPALLERVCAVDLTGVAAMSVTMAEIARVRATIIRLDAPPPAAGADAHARVFRILVPREYGEFVWHTVSEAGHDLGLIPVGAAAHARLVPEPAQ